MISRLRSPGQALLLVALASVSVLCRTSVALADGPSAAQEAQAEDLFQRSRALMAQKDFRAACPMLAESYRLAGGGGTLQNLAICYEEEGKVAFAYNRFLELRTMSMKANRADRVALADEHIAKLKGRISRLVIRVTEGSRVPGLKISVDNDDYGETSWSTGIVLNTGSHVVKVSAPGKKTVELRARIEQENKDERLDVPRLVDAPKDAIAPSSGASLDEIDRLASRRALRTTGFVVGGIGLGVAVAGGVFGVLTATTESTAKAACRDDSPGQIYSNKTGYRVESPALDAQLQFDGSGYCYRGTPAFARSNALHADARTFGTVSSVLVPVGLVGLALGSYLVYSSSGESEPTAPPDQSNVRARLTPTLGGFLLQGEFR